MSDDPKLDKFFREAGAELESAFRAKGSPLPDGLDAEALVRDLFEQMQHDASSEQGRERARRFAEVAREFGADLESRLEDPAFRSELERRMKQIIDETGSGSAASA